MSLRYEQVARVIHAYTERAALETVRIPIVFCWLQEHDTILGGVKSTA